MARTAITVVTLTNFQEGTQLTPTNGDAANDHSVDLSMAPRLHLSCYNSNGGAAVAFTIEYPSGKSTYSDTLSRALSVAADSAEVVVLDMPADIEQAGRLLNIDSADANFGDMRFFAYTWTRTPWRRY